MRSRRAIGAACSRGSLSWGAQKLVQVLSDAYVILDWDEATLGAKLAGTAAALQRPLTAAASLRAMTDPPAVRRAALKLLATALQWPDFMCASGLCDSPLPPHHCWLIVRNNNEG